MVGHLRDFLVAFARDRHHDALARFHFLDVGERLLVEHAALASARIARGQHHHRQILVDQRVGPVLHLARRITFGVNVGDLFQLQRAFERDREMNAAAQEQEIGRRGTASAPALRRCASCRQHRLPACPECVSSSCTSMRDVLSSSVSARLPQVHRQHEQRRQLAGERFGGRHADLRTRVRDRSCRPLRA